MRKGIFLMCLALGGWAGGQSQPAKPGPSPAVPKDTGVRKDTAQEAAVVEQLTTRVRYENDGTGKIEQVRAVRIQSQAGVEEYGQLVFGYSSATEKLDVSYVRVRKPNGQTVETPSTNAQDFAPEILRSAPMYSDFRERHVTVSSLRPGDLLEYATITHITTPLAAGEFWYEYDFPRHMAVTEARLEIDVPKDRELKLKSPSHKFTTADQGDRRTYTWLVEHIAPNRKDKDKNEESGGDDMASGDDEPREFPDVQLTTFKDWQQVAGWYAKLQGERVVLDAAIEKKAAELTRGAATQQEKARRIYDFVARDIRYVSLSFGVGRLQPHFANEVLAGSYGDCKDKHTLLSALLRAAGISSYPVLVGSERKLDQDVPSPAQFDHLITTAQVDKQWVWLDSTAEVAPFGLLLYQLRDKQAVVASIDGNGGLKKTPASAPVKNTLATNTEGKLSETGALDSGIEIAATGDSAVLMRMVFRATPQTNWQRVGEAMARYQGYRGQVSDLDVAGLEEPEKPLRVRFKVHEDSYVPVPSTNLELYVLPLFTFHALPKKKPGQPLDVGPALETHDKARLEFAGNYHLRLPPDVRISRDYGEYALSYRLTKAVLEADRTFILKVDQVPGSRRPDVESLRSVATNYAEQSVGCDVRPVVKPADASSLPATGTPQALRKAARKALDQRDFKNASELFRRLLEQHPESEDAWDELGRAYSGIGDHTAAISAYRKQVEVNAFHKRAYNDLGAELRLEGKYDEALAAYAKQLENVPLDNNARKNHGLLLLQLKRNQDALGDLEKASSSTPDDPEIEMALAQLYSWAGNLEKSRARLMSVVGSPTPAAEGDWFTAALRDDIDPEQTLSDARKIVDGIGDQFDAGAYEQSPPEVFSAMYYLALEWARIGWANFLKGDRMEGLKFLDAAWSLSQSGTVANRLARVYEKAGDTVKAKHLLLLAIAAGGAEVERSRAQLAKSGAGKGGDASLVQVELAQMESAKVRGLAQKEGQAEFVLEFDGSNRPQWVAFREGAPQLQKAEAVLTDLEYPVAFPENTSVKMVRRGVLSCIPAGCTIHLKPPDTVQAAPGAPPQK